MFKIFNYIGYFLKAKNGVEHPADFITDTSFAALETYFIGTFIIFGIFTGGLGFAAFYYSNNIILFIAILFLALLVFDIWLYIKIKNFVKKIADKAVNYSKNYLAKDTADEPYEFEIEID